MLNTVFCSPNFIAGQKSNFWKNPSGQRGKKVIRHLEGGITRWWKVVTIMSVVPHSINTIFHKVLRSHRCTFMIGGLGVWLDVIFEKSPGQIEAVKFSSPEKRPYHYYCSKGMGSKKKNKRTAFCGMKVVGIETSESTAAAPGECQKRH